MKKLYEKPMVDVDIFQANEYIAAPCYTLKCNTKKGTAYRDTNGVEGYQPSKYYDFSSGKWIKKDETITRGHGCGEEYHVKSDTPPVPNAMWHNDRGGDVAIFYWDVPGDAHFSVAGSWNSNTTNAS